MSGRAQKGRDRLERIAALLLALAGLAERAASRSAPVRFIVLWILGRAEEVAADFVAAQPSSAIWQGQVPCAPDRTGHTPADALALALSLRLLALCVQALAAEAGRLPDTAGISAFVENMARIVYAMTPAAPAAGAHRDTS